MVQLWPFGKKKEEKKPEDTSEHEDPIKYFGKSGWDKLPFGRGTSVTYEPEGEGEDVRLTPDSGYTAFPKSVQPFRLIYESQNTFIEESYYWFLHFMRYGAVGMPKVEKLMDTFSSSPGSSMFGMTEQRLAIQQDRAVTYMRYISEMIKSLHGIIHELRIADERLSFYEDTFNNKNSQASDHALKGLWIDMVEGGAKNPASVYGMAQQLSFSTLPDLFFRTRIDDTGMGGVSGIEYEKRARNVGPKIDEAVDKVQMNEKVKEVLRRKLMQFYTWKYRTYKEFQHRRKFQLKYLRQHYNTIRMYAEWLKPYLMNVKRLNNIQGNMNSPEIVNSFESAVLELELFGVAKPGDVNSCVSIHLKYVTMPGLQYVQDYQRGLQHNGRMELTVRPYAFTKNELKLYRKMRQDQAIEMLKEHDTTIAGVLDSLGDDLKEYLNEAGENIKTDREKEEEKLKKDEEEREQKRKKEDSLFGIFIDLYDGFREIFNLFAVPNMIESFTDKKAKEATEKDKKKAEKEAVKRAFSLYKFYKLSHRFMTW